MRRSLLSQATAILILTLSMMYNKKVIATKLCDLDLLYVFTASISVLILVINCDAVRLCKSIV